MPLADWISDVAYVFSLEDTLMNGSYENSLSRGSLASFVSLEPFNSTKLPRELISGIELLPFQAGSN